MNSLIAREVDLFVWQLAFVLKEGEQNLKVSQVTSLYSNCYTSTFY